MNAPYSILLIDDDRAWRETLADYLEGKGFHVRTVEGARQGLALLERGNIPGALIDFNRPDMNGPELLRRLWRRRRDLAVSFVSGEDDPSLPRRALAEGAQAF